MAPPDSPPRPPLAPRPRTPTLRDKLPSVPEEDAWEAALRDAKAKLDSVEAERDRERAGRQEAERKLSESGSVVLVPAGAAPPGGGPPRVDVEDPPDPKGISFRSRWGRLWVGGGAIAALVAPVVAIGQHFLGLEREVAALRQTVGSYAEGSAKLEQRVSTCEARQASITTTVADLSGFIRGAFPQAGVLVPKAADGSPAFDVETTRIPGAPPRQRPAVKITTPVPAPDPQLPRAPRR